MEVSNIYTHILVTCLLVQNIPLIKHSTHKMYLLTNKLFGYTFSVIRNLFPYKCSYMYGDVEGRGKPEA
jgi:hypothetical protein